MSLPLFGEEAVRSLATSESFSRGKDYFRSGAVSNLIRRGDKVTAQVEGYEVYDVTIRLHENGIAGTHCTCPYDWGGARKHVVAALLEFLARPSEGVTRPPLEEILRGLEREELASLFAKWAVINPDFILWLEAELAITAPTRKAGSTQAEVDPGLIRRQAQALLTGQFSQKRGRADDFSGPDEEAFAALIDKAKPFLEAGDGRNALAVLEPAADALVSEWIEYADTDETLHEFFPILGQRIAEAVLMGVISSAERDDLMGRLVAWQEELGEYGLDEHFQVAVDALEQGWDEAGLADMMAGKGPARPLARDDDWQRDQLVEARLRVLDISGRKEEFLNLARAAGRHGDYAGMLVRMGRSADAVAYSREIFQTSTEALELSRALIDAGHTEAALDLAAWGLDLEGDGDHSDEAVRLAHWLRDKAGALGRKELALKAAGVAFRRNRSLVDFLAAKSLAGQEWTELRPALLAQLAGSNYTADRTEIFLTENMIDEAVRSVDVQNALYAPFKTVFMRLAEAAHASHPEWVIDLSEAMAARIMDTGQVDSYELAAQWLEKAALAYEAAGRFEDWMARIDALVEKYRRKYKLKPLLEALRTGR